MEFLHCKKCLTSRTGDELGAPCKTKGCDGIIEKQPEFHTLVDRQPETFMCNRRAENAGLRMSPGPDYWNKFKTNGNRVCSYCGSLHWEDMLALVKQAADASLDAPYGSVIEIEPSDKNYKVYVHQPGVRNAHEGGIKFYMQHVPRNVNNDGIEVTKEQQAEYSRAVMASRARFAKMMQAQRSSANA